MKFRFAARVIAQLGAELISSDDIAIYELIKTAFVPVGICPRRP